MRNEAKYIEFFLPWLHGEPNADDEWRAYCPLHEDPATSKSPSASFNFDEGLWHCQSCTEGGAITHLYEKMAGDNVVDIKSRKKRGDVTTKPLPSAAQIDRWHEALVGNITKLRFMNQKRGLSVQTLKRFGIGWDGYRFTIPIYDEDDNLVNIRRYKPNAKDANDKMISWGVGWGTSRIYGFETLEENERVLLAEGELDRLIAVQEGLPAVTHTGGAAVFKREWVPHFKDKYVYVGYDDDDNGDAGASKVSEMLAGTAAGVYRLRIETGIKSGDITDHFVTNGDDAQTLWESMDDAQVLWEPDVPHEVPTSGRKVSVEESQNTEYDDPIELTVMVAGKMTPPYITPRELQGTCDQNAGEVCHFCPLSNNNGERTIHLDADDPRLLKYIDQSDKRKHELDVALLGAKCVKYITTEAVTEYSVEELLVTPSIEHRTEATETPIQRHVYNIGTYDTPTNQPARIVGAQVPDHRSQRGLLHTWHLEPVKTDIETFEMTPGLYKRLLRFRPANRADPLDKCFEIARDLSTNITHIYERELLHVAYDLVYHSAITFDFLGQTVRKGWLEALVIGDTRTGKSEAATRLIHHYGAGVIQSCESVTLPGLLGTVQQTTRDHWFITWGTLPLHDRRLVVLDEMSGLFMGANGSKLSKNILENLSSVRSEGVAQIAKAAAGETSARTRIIWLSNPLDGMLTAPGAALSSISHMIDKPEDIARFDFAMAIAENELDDDVINSTDHPKVRHRYTSELCHALIMWAWSRTADQIKWRAGAETAVLEAAQELGGEFVSDPPLIQRANVRIKIARLAVAIAVRTFSTTANGEAILVRKKHVLAAKRFLRMIYGTDVMGYASYSARVRKGQAKARENIPKAKEYLELNPEILMALRTVRTRLFRPQDFMEVGGVQFREEANIIINKFTRWNMLTSGTGGRYKMEPALEQVLREFDED